jgi:hypothetical protein
MNVFVSHAHTDRDESQAIALAIRAAGHEVFFDRDVGALPPGKEYDARIKRAIARADIFVFCLRSRLSDSCALSSNRS